MFSDMKMESYGKAPARTLATRDTAVYVLQQEARQLALEKSLLSRDLDMAHLRQRAAEELANEAVAQAQKTRMTAEEQALREQSLQEEVVKLRKIVSEIKKKSNAKAEACAVLLGALADAQEALALPTVQDMPGSDGLVPILGSGLLPSEAHLHLQQREHLKADNGPLDC